MGHSVLCHDATAPGVGESTCNYIRKQKSLCSCDIRDLRPLRWVGVQEVLGQPGHFISHPAEQPEVRSRAEGELHVMSRGPNDAGLSQKDHDAWKGPR